MKTESYLNRISSSNSAGLLEFAQDVVEFLFDDGAGTIDTDQEINGGDFVEYAVNRAVGLGLYPDSLEDPESTLISLEPREVDTILAALRSYQGAVKSPEILEIASSRGEPLDLKAIDALCERIN